MRRRKQVNHSTWLPAGGHHYMTQNATEKGLSILSVTARSSRMSQLLRHGSLGLKAALTKTKDDPHVEYTHCSAKTELQQWLRDGNSTKPPFSTFRPGRSVAYYRYSKPAGHSLAVGVGVNQGPRMSMISPGPSWTRRTSLIGIAENNPLRKAFLYLDTVKVHRRILQFLFILHHD